MTPRRSLVWLVALVVAASVAATAHGLYAVALTSGVPWQVATLYPLITDGLALVAYAATKQLRSARYAWFVVVVAAGLSGLAQAVNLAGLGESPVWLRFGVGYWPAVAVLFAAHLLWLVGRPRAGMKEVGDGKAQRAGELEEGAGGAGREQGQDGDRRLPEGEPAGDRHGAEGRPLVSATDLSRGPSAVAVHLLDEKLPAAQEYERSLGRRPSRRQIMQHCGVGTERATRILAELDRLHPAA